MTTRSKTIHRLLSLVLCLCMVLTLLPMIPMEAEAAAAKTLYLKPNSNWTQANARFAAYFFNNSTGKNTWAGMTDSDKDGIYEVTVPEGDWPNVIFCRMNPNTTANNWNNGTMWNQTADLTVPTNSDNCYVVKSGTWNTGGGSWCQLCYHTFSGNTCSKCNTTGVTIYFQNNWKWSKVSLYYWFGPENALYNMPHPGVEMTYYDNDGSNDYYVMTIPQNVTAIQFNGIKDDGSSTRDKIDITSGWKNNLCYYMEWDNGNVAKTFDISTVKFPCKHKNVVDVAGTDATCTATGLTAGTKCADCDEPIQAQTEIPALGHTWSNATCDAPKTCSVCGTTEGDALGHSYVRECDTNCFICGQETRPEAVHVSNYSYPCRDGVCMYGCGTEMPATAEHTYDNACDATCNVCAEPREVAGHNWIDATCTDPMYCDICYVTEGEPAGHGHTEGFVYHMYTDYHEVWCADCWDYSYQENHTIGEDHYCICGQEELMTVTFLVDGQVWTTFDRYYNTPVAFAGMNFPTKEGYSFTGWYTADGEKIQNRTMVLENMIVHAGFQINTFSVTWNVAGVEIEETYEYGMIPEFTGSTDKAQEGCDVYTFIGWDQPIVAVTGDVTYTAVYTSAKSHTAEVVPGYAADCTNTGLTDGSKCAVCGETLIAQEIIPATGIHADADKNYRCDSCNKLMQDAQLAKVSVSLKGNIAVNYYMLLTDEVLADSTAYMQFTMADGEIIQIPVADGVKMVLEGETYYVYTCAVSAKEMTDDILSQFFYAGGETKLHTYKIQTYGKHILAAYDDQDTRDLITAMLNYGAASQLHFGYNTDKLANDVRDDKGNALIDASDYSNVTIEGFNAVAGQGTDLAKFYSASLILKSETTVRFFFQVDSAASFTASYNGQELTVSKRGSLHYVDVVGISAKDLDEDVTITINDGTNTTEVSFNPMSYCQGVLNDTTGAFSNEMKDLVCALYLYNQAANVYFKEV